MKLSNWLLGTYASCNCLSVFGVILFWLNQRLRRHWYFITMGILTFIWCCVSISDLLRCLPFYCHFITCSVYNSSLTSLPFCFVFILDFCFSLFHFFFSILLNLFHLFLSRIDVRLLLIGLTSFCIIVRQWLLFFCLDSFGFFLSVGIFSVLSRCSLSFTSYIFLLWFYSPSIGCIFLSDYVIPC